MFLCVAFVFIIFLIVVQADIQWTYTWHFNKNRKSFSCACFFSFCPTIHSNLELYAIRRPFTASYEIAETTRERHVFIAYRTDSDVVSFRIAPHPVSLKLALPHVRRKSTASGICATVNLLVHSEVFRLSSGCPRYNALLRPCSSFG